MKDRCYNPNNEQYADWGGRGIQLDPTWLNSFETFLLDIGRRPSSTHTIERKDNDGDYTPENCVWATRMEQNKNKRSNRMISFDGRTLHLAEWARQLGLDAETLSYRLKHWPLERALTEPRRNWP